jgi:hypothetical protein
MPKDGSLPQLVLDAVAYCAYAKHVPISISMLLDDFNVQGWTSAAYDRYMHRRQLRGGGPARPHKVYPTGLKPVRKRHHQRENVYRTLQRLWASGYVVAKPRNYWYITPTGWYQSKWGKGGLILNEHPHQG